MKKIKTSVLKALQEEGKNFEQKLKQLKQLENVYKKTMGFENTDTRSPSAKAVSMKSSTPKPTKLSDSGFISQGHQLKNLVRKLKGKKQKRYKDEAYKTLVKGT